MISASGPNSTVAFLMIFLAVWPGSRAELLQFEAFLNSLIPGIKVTFAACDQAVEFLDTVVYKAIKAFDPDGLCCLKTKVFFNQLILINYCIALPFIPGILSSGLLNPNSSALTIYPPQFTTIAALF